jgi:hypothetical protein
MNGIAEKRIRVATTFPAHDGKFVLKYFMLRQSARIQRWKHPRLRG